ncbi:TPA: hypothetical protein MO340_004310 [Salmonella enterica subsp. salamae serovar 35:g,m,s,t:-]|nr:hypothetical protein [Salmonella enterica subsp. salamae serovar 35:g,m,s,t:-]HCA3549780.1 hypothetical protein [Salmonella enterica subsp. salamae serovar 35:g,m,s,t:-]
MSTSTEQRQTFIVDEASCFYVGKNDSLKKKLRNIGGVPNATYEVKEGRVFVFDKLVHLISDLQLTGDDLAAAIEAHDLIKKSTVTTQEAIESWGIVPEPYTMVETVPGNWAIVHKPFYARLPQIYKSPGEVMAVFASLLLGDIQPGEGDFTYRGQPMVLLAPFDIASLPSRPIPHLPPVSVAPGFTYLGACTYEQGFEPIPENLFNDVKKLESSWKNDCTNLELFAKNNAADIWTRLSTLRVDSLDDPTLEVPEYGTEEHQKLRSLYPELSMLSDGALYSWFDEFQVENCYCRGWSAYRDDVFLFFLLGKIAGGNSDSEITVILGQWVTCSLCRGDTLDEAISFAKAMETYFKAITNRAKRIRSAMDFLKADTEKSISRGQHIVTMSDMFFTSRKFSGNLVEAEQNINE